ncbi:MAG: 3'-5' exonuclease, partial [Rickettsiaceae bacterium]|nr:3'-5' exonuclease [Rickettsiaceae bacterium]
MSNQPLDQIANQLRKSDEYRVIQKYQKPKGYNLDSNNDCDVNIENKHKNKNKNKSTNKLIGVYLDIEATGLLYSNDKLIELGMVKFEYTQDGRIFNLLEEFSGYQDPNIPISGFITKLTGINDDMVRGHSIDEDEVSEYLKDVEIIIAHNAQFDRAFFETTFPNIAPKAWACSMRDINWNDEDISSFKLEYIAYRYNFFFEGHRAIIDCLAGIHILSQELYNSKQLALKQLLDNAMQPRFKLWAQNAAYAHKDLLRARQYRWDTHPAH